MAHPFAQEITHGLPKLVNIILWPIHISSGYPPVTLCAFPIMAHGTLVCLKFFSQKVSLNFLVPSA